jgi:hypothetical protein
VCFLCQRTVNSDDLYTCELSGPLSGMRICLYHGDLGTEPNWVDLRGVDATLVDAVVAAVREEPYGDTPWWDEDGVGVLLREDGVTPLYREDSLGGFTREA